MQSSRWGEKLIVKSILRVEKAIPWVILFMLCIFHDFCEDILHFKIVSIKINLSFIQQVFEVPFCSMTHA